VRLAGEERLRRAPLASEEADAYLGDLDSETRFSQAWLVAPDGRRWSGAEAIWHALYLAPVLGPILRPLRWLPGFHPISRRVYQWVAAQRRHTSCRLRATSSHEHEKEARP
jgi:predicted DCC family thiol-disulfide oxidoreductase YuxK